LVVCCGLNSPGSTRGCPTPWASRDLGEGYPVDRRCQVPGPGTRAGVGPALAGYSGDCLARAVAAKASGAPYPPARGVEARRVRGPEKAPDPAPAAGAWPLAVARPPLPRHPGWPCAAPPRPAAGRAPRRASGFRGPAPAGRLFLEAPATPVSRSPRPYLRRCSEPVVRHPRLRARAPPSGRGRGGRPAYPKGCPRPSWGTDLRQAGPWRSNRLWISRRRHASAPSQVTGASSPVVMKKTSSTSAPTVAILAF
jgi:hypothetical protein